MKDVKCWACVVIAVVATSAAWNAIYPALIAAAKQGIGCD